VSAANDIMRWLGCLRCTISATIPFQLSTSFLINLLNFFARNLELLQEYLLLSRRIAINTEPLS